VAAVEAGHGGRLDLGVLDGRHLLEHRVEGDAEPLDGIEPLKHRKPPHAWGPRSAGNGGPPRPRCCRSAERSWAARGSPRTSGSRGGPAVRPRVRPPPAPWP